MTTPRLPDPILSAWLEEGPNELPDQTRRAIAVGVRTTNQRRRGVFAPWRDTNVNGNTRLVVATIAVVVAVGGGLYLFGNRAPGPSGGVGGQPSPSTAPASATASPPSPAASARELPIRANRELTAGRYSLAQFPVAISFEIPPFEPPAEWSACSPSAVEQAACYTSDDTLRDTSGVAVTFHIVENVVVDPCSDQETAELREPPVGPSVDDLVTAISSLEGFEATDPVDITVSGFDGKEFTLTAPATDCGATWATADRTTGMGPGEVNLLRVLDDGGERLSVDRSEDVERDGAVTAPALHDVGERHVDRRRQALGDRPREAPRFDDDKRRR